MSAGEQEHAGRLLSAAEAVAEATGVSLEPFERGIHDRTVDAVTVALGREGFAAMHTAGRKLELQRAVEYALEPAVDPAAVAAAPPLGD